MEFETLSTGKKPSPTEFFAPDRQRISRLQSIHALLNREERRLATRARIRVEALLVHEKLRGMQSGGEEEQECCESHDGVNYNLIRAE